MRRPTTALLALAAAALPGAPALAHHSQAMFEMSQGILIEVTVARFDWVNPHTYADRPADVQPTRMGHSIGRWESDTLVIDEEPATLTMRKDQRTDLEFAPAAETCDAEVAQRYLGH